MKKKGRRNLSFFLINVDIPRKLEQRDDVHHRVELQHSKEEESCLE
jgi:hypothetical protein